jgi:lysyl-tRNA synthetase class 2
MPSSAIRTFRYQSATRQLFVTFVTGREYVYDNVPPEVHDAFRAASSRGTFFNTEIRGFYDFREITPGGRQTARPGMAPDRKTASRR